jgi:dihydrodipicolinate synthase/N-acetylneuraminate lyase
MTFLEERTLDSMASTKPPRGLIIDLITPLRENGAIDSRGLGRHLDRVLPCVQGVFLASPYAGEGRMLDFQRREDLFDKSLVVIRGCVPLWVWITGETRDETQKMLRLLEKRLAARNYTGPLFWVDTPLFYHSNRGLFSHYRDLASLTGVPFILHNDPDLIKDLARPLKRNNLRTSILKELVEIENIRGLIFLGPLERAQNYQRAVRQRADFRMYDGDEARFLTYPSRSGIVSVGANLAPRTWQKVTKSSLNLIEGKEEYPDSLQQLWEAGEYLRALRDNYHPHSGLLTRRVLADMGIIGSPGSSKRQLEHRVGELKKLMTRYADFPLDSSSD